MRRQPRLGVRLAAVGAALALALLVTGPTAVMGAEPETGSGPSIRAVETRDFPLVSLTIALPQQGTLEVGDVRVVENGVPVRVARVEPLEGTGRNVDAVLAIDVSNSMEGTELATALAAARTFVTDVPESIPVGLVTFAREAVVRSPITDDRVPVQAAVAATDVSTTQGTALFDAVAAGVSLFPAGGGQHNLIVLTDGRNTEGTLDLASAASIASEAGVTVFAVGLEGPETDVATLEALAGQTGGRFASITPQDLQAVYAGLARELSQQFVITYRSKAPYAAPASVTVETPFGIAQTRFLTPGLGAGAASATAVSADEASLITSPEAMALVSLLTFAAVMNLLLVIQRERRRRRREEQLRTRVIEAGLPAVRQASRESQGVVPRRLVEVAERTAGAKRSGVVELKLHQAGWSFRPGEFLVMTAAAALIGGLAGSFLLGRVGLLLAVPAGILPFLLLSGVATKRLKAIQAQLADALMVIASSLRAGHSFLQSLDTATKEIDDPAGSEFQRVMTEIRFGRDVDAALEGLAERIGSQDLEWAVTAIKIQRKVGGNLAEVLETVANTIRERETLRRQVRVLSAEGRLSVIVLTVLPILVALYLMTVNPTYLRVLTTTRAGIIIISIAGALMVVGYAWMQRIVKVDV